MVLGLHINKEEKDSYCSMAEGSITRQGLDHAPTMALAAKARSLTDVYMRGTHAWFQHNVGLPCSEGAQDFCGYENLPLSTLSKGECCSRVEQCHFGRTGQQRKSLLPVWSYLDEASRSTTEEGTTKYRMCGC